MKSALSILPWLAIALWCGYVFLTVPEAHNPFPKSSRHWLSQKLFGGKRGAMMLAGTIGIGLLSGMLLAVAD